jgi:hypothetical protein
MKKKLLILVTLLIMTCGVVAQVVTTASAVTVCTGATTVQIPVKVTSFTAVGSISLRLSYVNSEITSPTIVYKDPGLEAWGTFLANTSTPGVIIISAYDPDVVAPIPGLTLAANTTLFTIQFSIATIVTPAVVGFLENVQGTWCEYGGVGPNYTPFTDVPMSTYYLNGGVTVVADPVAPGLTRNPNQASVCTGQTLTVTTTPGSGGTGTITDEYRYSTDNGGTWSAWGTSLPSFNAVVGTSRVQSRRTATGIACDESTYNEVSWAVVADPTAPGLTKNPAVAAVCAGQTLTVTTTAGSGGAGTVADEYRYSSDNGSTWTSWSSTVPSFTAVAGTSRVQSRRTASGSGCDVSSSNEVSWTVAADPVAPGISKNPASATVCAGDILTVTTSPGSGGTGTIADEYRYSTNNGSSWSAWSASVPSFAAVAGTNRIQSRRTASGTGCDESTYNEVSWIVNAKQKISGTFNYHRSSGDILLTGADITVNLYKSSDLSHTTLIASDVTDASGYYEFPAICPDCEYDLVATSTHTTDGAVNTTDAAQANYWGPNSYSIEKVRFHAGDVVGPNRFIGGTDAGRIQQYFVSGTSFDREPWTFWRSGYSILHNPLVTDPEFTEYYPKVTLSVGSDADADMYGLVSGDFNRSFNPSLSKESSASMELVYSGSVSAAAGEELSLPLRLTDAAEVGAISLILEIPDELAGVTDVVMPANNGQLQWSFRNSELRISWLSPSPLPVNANGELLGIRLKTTEAFTSGKSLAVKLAASPLNELTNGDYEVVTALLATATIESSVLGTAEPSLPAEMTVKCYPNPAAATTHISYALPAEGIVNLAVYNLLGAKVATLCDQTQPAGNHLALLETGSLPSGVYTVALRLETPDSRTTRTIKLVISR